MPDYPVAKILTKATSYDLLSLDELKLALNITSTTDDAKLQQDITRYSDVVAELCNRIFAREEVVEIWRHWEQRQIWLEHFPVVEADIVSIESPAGSVLDPSGYELDEATGRLEFLNGYGLPVVVHYWGGYLLPDDAPPALKQACELVVRDARMLQSVQATSGIRSLMHKDARVMFFDNMQSLIAAQKNAGQAFASPSVQALLNKFTRFYA